MIFQQFNLVGRLDVLNNVLLGRLSDGVNLPWQPIDNAAYNDTIKMIQFVDKLRGKAA
jgi:ABC-type phosphate/phosphonate transport system ATPase subunit